MDNVNGKTKKNEKEIFEVSLYEDHLVTKKHPLHKKGKKENSGLFYLGYVGQVGLVIALPIAGGAVIGSSLDAHWRSYPNMTMIALGIGIVISIVNFVAVIREIIKGNTN